MFRLLACVAVMVLLILQGCGDSKSEPIVPIDTTDREAFVSELSEGERACFSDSGLEHLLSSSGSQASAEETKAYLECLEHDTELRMFISGAVLDQRLTEPLSSESSRCIRDGFESTDLTAITLATGSSSSEVANAAGGQMMAAVVLTLFCLNDEELEVVAPHFVARPDDPATLQCVVDEMGGFDEIKSQLETELGEADHGNAFVAMFDCGFQPFGGQ